MIIASLSADTNTCKIVLMRRVADFDVEYDAVDKKWTDSTMSKQIHFIFFLLFIVVRHQLITTAA